MKDGKRGVVLSGGGTKGAYEIGVWKAMDELGIDYDIVTGTSIGSINGAMMAMRAFDEAKNVWENMVMEDFMGEPKSKGESVIEFFRSFVSGVVRPGSRLREGSVNNSPFREFVAKNVDEERIRASDVNYGLVTVRARDRKAFSLSTKEIPEGLLKDYVIASSSVYPVFPMHRIGEDYYIDGMYHDNLPIDLAVSMGATELIVVDLHQSPQHPKYAGAANVVYLTPSEDLGGILAFDRQLINKNIQMGYEDAMRKFSLLSD